MAFPACSGQEDRLPLLGFDLAREHDRGAGDAARTKIGHGEEGGVGTLEAAAIGRVARERCGGRIDGMVKQSTAHGAGDLLRTCERKQGGWLSWLGYAPEHEALSEDGSCGDGRRAGGRC